MLVVQDWGTAQAQLMWLAAWGCCPHRKDCFKPADKDRELVGTSYPTVQLYLSPSS